jgi:hypothetical protein
MATPWTAGPDDVLANTFLSGNEPATGHSVPSPPGIAGLTHVGNADKDGTTNSDLAFWGTLAYAGNYSGFRVLDCSGRVDEVREGDVYRPAASLGLGGARTWAYSNPQTQEAWQAP